MLSHPEAAEWEMVYLLIRSKTNTSLLFAHRQKFGLSSFEIKLVQLCFCNFFTWTQ